MGPFVDGWGLKTPFKQSLSGPRDRGYQVHAHLSMGPTWGWAAGGLKVMDGA